MRVSGALVAGVFLLVACGSSGGEEGGGAPIPEPTDATAFFKAYYLLTCQNATPCCKKEGLAHDTGFCKVAADIEAAFALSLFKPSDKVQYVESAGRACLEMAKADVAACEYPSFLDCEGVFVGSVEPGGACKSGFECADGAGAFAKCDSGQCVTQARGQNGSPCDWSCSGSANATVCMGVGLSQDEAYCYASDGLFCSGSTDTCQPLIALGGSGCNGMGCETGSYCASGSCVAPKAVGSPCASDAECDPKTAMCAGSLCIAKKANGESCEWGDECVGGNCEEDKCTSMWAGICDSN